MAEDFVHICLVVLSGLPGSGKTTLCAKLKERLTQKSSSTSTCIHVCYDQLLRQDIEEKLLSDSLLTGESGWKKYRSGISLCVEKLIIKLTIHGHLQPCDSNDLEEIHGNALSQKSTLQLSQRPQCTEKPEGIDDDLWERFNKHVEAQICSEKMYNVNPVVILIDDNMFYRSMRYTYYQIARQYQISFCQINLNCSVESALKNNKHRDIQTPQHIIEGMHSRLEPPDPHKNTWELLSLIISDFDITNLQEIEDFIRNASANPVSPIISAEAKEEQERSREICLQSFTHQADQLLRKLIGQQMKQLNDKKNVTKNAKKEFGEKLNSVRTYILDDIKHGNLPHIKSSDYSEHIRDRSSVLYQNIEDIFMYKIKDIKSII